MLSLSLIKNSEFLLDETPTAFLLSNDFNASEISLYVRPREVILVESTSIRISSSASPYMAVA